MSTEEFISGKVTDTTASNFLKKSSTIATFFFFFFFFCLVLGSKLLLLQWISDFLLCDYSSEMWKYSNVQLRLHSPKALKENKFKKLCPPSVHFKENVCKKKFISAEVIEYFLQPFEKRIPQQSFQRCFPKALKQSK